MVSPTPKFISFVAIILALALSACGEKPKPIEAASASAKGLDEGMSFSTDGLNASQKKQFNDFILANGSQFSMDDLPPDLRAALMVGAKKTNKVEKNRVVLPQNLAQFQFAKYLSAPSSGPPLAGPVRSQSGEKDLSRLVGRYHLVTVWATSCAPCIAEFKDFGTLARSLAGKNIVVAAIQSEANSPELESKVTYALRKAGDISGIEMWRDASTSGEAILQTVKGIPLTVLIAPDGKEIGRVVGSISSSEQNTTIWGTADTRQFMERLVEVSSLDPAPNFSATQIRK